MLVFLWEFLKTVVTERDSPPMEVAREVAHCVLKMFERASIIALSIMPGLVYAASK
jgi:hypothetical protein